MPLRFKIYLDSKHIFC